MHIYITGASGFVGSAITSSLLAQGHCVSAQTRYPGGQRQAAGLSWVHSPQQLTQPVDLLINLAGKPLLTHWTANAKQAIRDSRVGLTDALYRCFSERPELVPKRLFSASAIGIYATGEIAADENAPYGDDFAAELCLDWEAKARKFEQLGSQVCCLRFGVVLDPAGGALGAMLPAFKLGVAGRLGSGQQMFSWISRDDLVQAVLWAWQQDQLPPAINLSAPGPVTNSDFTRQLAQRLKRPAVFPVPTTLLKLLLGEGAEGFLLADLDVRPGYLCKQQFTFVHPDLSTFLLDKL